MRMAPGRCGRRAGRPPSSWAAGIWTPRPERRGWATCCRGGLPARRHPHGDHLGSVSVATDNDRRVVSRQDYTPWGEARAGDITQTTLDCTGQRKDGTGLLYYGARYYDPTLGRFLSPDSVAPMKTDPQSRNRYSYVLNNPLKYTDPTGYCVSGKTYEEMSGFERAENAACDMYISWLQGWGLDVDRTNYNNWQSYQLGAVWEGVQRMSNMLGWGTDGHLFQEKVLQGGRLVIDKVLTNEAGGCGVAYACTEADASKITFSVNGLTGANQDQWAFNQSTVVHELSHVWDYRLKKGAAPLTDGLASVLARAPNERERDRGYRGRSGIEDFADSVASFVMGGTRAQTDTSFYGSIRENYVACVATSVNRAEGRCSQ